MTENEAAALALIKRYRRQVDLLEDSSARQLAKRFDKMQTAIRQDMASLREADARNRPLIVRYRIDVVPLIERRLITYTRDASEEMDRLTWQTAHLGISAAYDSAKKVTAEKEQNFPKINAAGLFTGGLFRASKEALSRIPSAVTEKLTQLVGQAVGMAENGLDWLMSQLGDVLSGAWSSLERIIRTAAEQMFRRGQQAQRQQTPVRRWRRCANHETACLACLMLEGTVYDRETDFSDHPRGRCYIVPCEGDAQSEPTGRRWLEEQDEETQKRIMGKKRWEAWQDGKIGLDQMTTVKPDPIYGPQPRVISLKDLGLR